MNSREQEREKLTEKKPRQLSVEKIIKGVEERGKRDRKGCLSDRDRGDSHYHSMINTGLNEIFMKGNWSYR